MGPDIVVAIPRIAVVLFCASSVWLFFSGLVASFLGSKCHKHSWKTNLYCFLSRKGKQPSRQKQRLVGWSLVILGPFVIAVCIMCLVGAIAWAGAHELFERAEKAIGL